MRNGYRMAIKRLKRQRRDQSETLVPIAQDGPIIGYNCRCDSHCPQSRAEMVPDAPEGVYPWRCRECGAMLDEFPF